MGFNVADSKELTEGLASDVYFSRSVENLPSSLDDRVVAEFTVSSFSDGWIVFSGLDEVLEILKGKNVTLHSLPEGTVTGHRDSAGVPIPFMSIEGRYRDFGALETAILGLVCQSSGISSYASKVRIAAGDKPFASFGIRRMHPALSPMIDRAAYIGGADGVSGILGARLIGKPAFGTMPHSLSILLGDDKAWGLTLKSMKKDEVKSLLIDTFMDEKFAAIRAAEMFPNLEYIRLDTVSSRRGNFSAIVREVRWELNLRGYNHVKIMVSGGLGAEEVRELSEAGADSFGVGTSISSAPPVNFAMDIVEVAGESKTKRGKFSGRKQPFRCPSCGDISVVPWGVDEMECHCGGKMQKMMKQFISNGKTTGKYESPDEIRNRTISELKKFSGCCSEHEK